MWCWAHGLECGVDKWKFLSPVLKQPKLRQQQQYEDFSILELLVMSVTWGRAENTFFFSLHKVSRGDFTFKKGSFGGS